MFPTLFSLGLSWNPAGLSKVQPLFAYLDPGSGSMALQVIIAGLLSSAFFLKSSWTRVRTWISANRVGQ
jgi:hypothetical protein